MPAARIALTAADRLAVTAVAQAAMRPEEPVEYFQARRLAHPRRAVATWWLLEEQGRAVSSLVCHPLEFSALGAVFPGYGLGAVATLPEARGRGHARQLCEHAIAAAENEGRRVGLLYSAIPPAYYERLDFAALPGWQHACEQPGALAESGPRATLTAIDPRREAGRLAALYEAHHGASLHVARDERAFERSLALNPDGLFLGLGQPLRGYARLLVDPTSVEITELIVPEEDRAPVLRSLAHVAARLPRARLEGWFEPCAPLSEHLHDEGRAKTLPMVRGAPADPTAQFWSTDYF